MILRRGTANTVDELVSAAEYVLVEGNPNVILCEHGIRTFERLYELTLDFAAVPLLKERTHLPIVVDPSAAGRPNRVAPLALAAAAAGADGIILEADPGDLSAYLDIVARATPPQACSATSVRARERRRPGVPSPGSTGRIRGTLRPQAAVDADPRGGRVRPVARRRRLVGARTGAADAAGHAGAVGGARGRHRALRRSRRCVRGERWQALLRHNGAHPKRADSYALNAVGYMGNNVLPARAGDAFRVVFMAPRADTGARTVIGTLVAERLLDIAVLGTAFLVLTFGFVDHAGLPSGSRLRFVAGASSSRSCSPRRRSSSPPPGHRARLWAFVAPMIAATARPARAPRRARCSA